MMILYILTFVTLALSGQNERVYDFVDRLPTYKHGIDSLKHFIYSNSASKTPFIDYSKVYLSFIVEIGGQLTDIKLLRRSHLSYEKVAKNLLEETTGNWIPGVKDSSIVRTRIKLAIDLFEKKDVVMKKIETSARYKDGMQALYKAVHKSVIIPKESMIDCFHGGKVYVKFTVDTIGEFENIQIQRGISPECNLAAINSLKKTSGDWISAKEGNQKVSQSFILPVKVEIEPKYLSKAGKEVKKLFDSANEAFLEKNYEKALMQINQVIDQCSNHYEAIFNKALYLFELNDAKEACNTLQILVDSEELESIELFIKKCR